MKNEIKSSIDEMIEPLKLLNDKYIFLYENSNNMSWEENEEALMEIIDEIEKTSFLLDKSLDLVMKESDYLYKNYKNMSWEEHNRLWETNNELFENLIDYQTELTEKQGEFSQKLTEMYSEELKRLESNEMSMLGSIVSDIKDIVWNGIKYAWDKDNQEELKQDLDDKRDEVRDRILDRKSKADKDNSSK